MSRSVGTQPLTSPALPSLLPRATEAGKGGAWQRMGALLQFASNNAPHPPCGHLPPQAVEGGGWPHLCALSTDIPRAPPRFPSLAALAEEGDAPDEAALRRPARPALPPLASGRKGDAIPGEDASASRLEQRPHPPCGHLPPQAVKGSGWPHLCAHGGGHLPAQQVSLLPRAGEGGAKRPIRGAPLPVFSHQPNPHHASGDCHDPRT